MSKMGRPKKEPKEVKESVTLSLLPDITRELEAIAYEQNRTRSQVGALLLLRGLAAFQRDGSLVETFSQRTVQVSFVEPREKPPAKAKAK